VAIVSNKSCREAAGWAICFTSNAGRILTRRKRSSKHGAVCLGVGLLLFIYLSVPFPVEDGGPTPLASVFLFNFLSPTIGPLIGAFWGRQLSSPRLNDGLVELVIVRVVLSAG
jgi:hypothetical protein